MYALRYEPRVRPHKIVEFEWLRYRMAYTNRRPKRGGLDAMKQLVITAPSDNFWLASFLRRLKAIFTGQRERSATPQAFHAE